MDKWSQPRSVVAAPAPISPAITSANNSNPKPLGQKRIRHRRIGSTGSNGHFGSTSARSSERRSVSETRQIKMVDMETQTDTMDISTDCSPSSLNASRDISMYLRSSPSFTISSPTIKVAKKISTRNYRNHDQEQYATDATSPNDDSEMTTSNEKLNDKNNCCSKSDEQLSTDYMNSNEQLDIRDSSDDDNLERLGRRVNEFISENRLSLHSDNGNGSTVIDGRLLFNVMTARRSCISMNENDKVTVISRCNSYINSTNNNTSNSNSIQPQALVYKRKDHNFNNDEGDVDADNDDDDDDDNGNEYCDDSWTDEEGEDSDANYTSLRRRRCVLIG